MIKGARLVGAAAMLISSGLSVIAIDTSLSADAALPGTAMPLQEFVNDGAGGRAWNAYNQTQASAGPTIAGRPSPVTDGNTVQVYTRAASGDLTEFANDGAGGRAWNPYDITTASNGPRIAGDPGAVLFNATIDVFAEASTGDLVEFANDGAARRAWNAYDITAASGGVTIGGDPTAIVRGSLIDVYVRAASGDLMEYESSGNQVWTATDLTQASGGPVVAGDPGAVVVGTTAHVYAQAQGGDLIEFVNDGPGNQSWVATDLSANASGPTVTGRPSPVLSSSVIDVYARAASGDMVQFEANAGSRLWSATDLSVSTNGPKIGGDPGAVLAGTSIDVYTEATSGDLTEFVNDGASGRLWNSYDRTQDAGAGIAIGGDPSPLANGASVQVYAAGPPPATAPGGVGLYGLLPGTQTPLAIENGWPVIGDTGALGTTTAPYTGFSLNDDLQTGLDIAASSKRITWLSFWTVSGPVASGPGGSACYTSDCYYAAADAAGRWVATTIDGYSSSGLNLKPDWVILDPEGYPDNHSGLDSGPGATAANWTSFLTGWANGLGSVDPSLHAGFYVDQNEYNAFDLSAIQLPAFVALEFPDPTNILDNNDNVAGYIAAGATCPASSEEQTLLGPAWYGSYNTLEFVTGYCPP
jgi:hypothetical protein